MEPFSVNANGMTFRGVHDGPEDGPLALLLHGFPDSHLSFRHLLGPLAERGYHAVAPAMRGYAPSDLPVDGYYQSGALSLDAIELHAALGGDERAVLIGHDWGAVAGYGAVAFAPTTFAKLITMGIPPTSSVAESFLRFDQLKRSWYMFFFLSPLADLVVPMGDLEFIARLWEDWSPGYDATEDLGYVREAIGEPERLQAALGYYRAMFDPSVQAPSLAEVQDAFALPSPVPTLYLHGAQDGCFGVDAIGDPVANLPEGSAMSVIEGAGHFLHLERPKEVAVEILDFLSR